MRTVTLLYVDGCPNWRTLDARLRAVADEMDLTIVRREISSVDEATKLGFPGSPTILVDGTDPFARSDEPTGLDLPPLRDARRAGGVPDHGTTAQGLLLTGARDAAVPKVPRRRGRTAVSRGAGCPVATPVEPFVWVAGETRGRP